MYQIDKPVNEGIRSYQPGSVEREELQRSLAQQSERKEILPNWIGGKESKGSLNSLKKRVVMPHDHHHVLGEYFWADASELKAAARAALDAKPKWEALEWQERAAIFLKAADLLAGPYRSILNAATMLGQSKNAYQAEIDSACELIDFLRFNAYFYCELQKNQPVSSSGVWNRMDYRPLEGFVLAITPFNFTAIAGNLPALPAMLGNTVVWKPSDTQMLSAHFTMQILREAGLPDGVINLVAAEGPLVSETLVSLPELAGIHFTGSTATFQTLWKKVGENIHRYKSYPRLVGETGGKDFVFAHPSAEPEALITALIRGAFEYQGQKCSAASRAYIPQSVWKKIQSSLIEQVADLKMGDVRDFSNFVNAVIDERSFNKISGYLEYARTSPDAKILVGGKAHSEKGYFIEPTVIVTTKPQFKTMVEEIFGPVLTIYVYEDSEWEQTLKLCDEASPYALTGAIFSQDRYAIQKMSQILRHTAGNFYINDKPTGAVVGQQPFGGGRASGTNDKAGSVLNLYRWLSPRSIKETLVPAKDYRYPFMK